VGITAAIGKKDKGILIKPRDNYLRQLSWVTKKYVMLYDVNDRRAWLVDGASALLHLVRSSIKHFQESKVFAELCLFRWENLQEAIQEASGEEAALSVLTNEDNMRQEIFKRPVEEWQEESIDAAGNRNIIRKSKTSFVRFSDIVEQTFQMLEQIFDHKAAAAAEDGYGFKLRTSSRRQLEGFDFIDIAEDRDPLYSHVHTLHDSGKGWVDFVRAIQAITLFGNGFGELIKPVNLSTLCPSWWEVPRNRDYLAVTVSTMKELLRRGDVSKAPWRVADDIYWHTPDRTFEECNCRSITVQCDRVQVLLPPGLQKACGKGFRSPACLMDEGALIFGHSLKFPLRWKDHEDPSAALIQNEYKKPGGDDSPRDSGLGTDLASSTNNECSMKVDDDPSIARSIRNCQKPLAQSFMNSASRAISLHSFEQMVRRLRGRHERDESRPE
jgi:hypothetical protein